MSQLLSLSRAARLVGVARSVLQKKIRDDELETFEGRLNVNDLLAIYPNVQLEDTTLLERIEHIKKEARYTITPEESMLSNAKALEVQLIKLSAQLNECTESIAIVTQSLGDMLAIADEKTLRTALKSLHTWLVDVQSTDNMDI